MTNRNDQELLRDYAARHGEAAFAELVRRHIDLVYSAALRMVRDAHLAEDVTQGVFMALAQNAGQLADRPVLAGWLHCTAQNIAAQTVRTEVRRHVRELEAASMHELLSAGPEIIWEQIASQLDAVMGELDDFDRDALLLRYFGRKSAQEMAETLGISSEAAQKRVNRAVDRLRELFAKRGVAVGVGGLAAAISTHAVQAAPTGLATTVAASVAFAGTASLTSTVITTTKTIAMTTTQKILVSVALAACVGTPLAVQHHSQAQLRVENELLRTQLSQQAQLAADNERLSRLLEQMTQTNSQSLPKTQFDELLRLRGEVGRLRTEARELAQMKSGAKAANEPPANPLLAQLQQMPEKSIPELQLLDEKKWAEDAARAKMDTPDGVREALANLRRAAKIRFAFELGAALNDYAQANNGQLPGNLSDLKPYVKYPADQPPVDDTVFQRYELLHSGLISDTQPGEPLIAEKGPVDDAYDTLFKIGANGYTMQGTGKWSGQPAFTNSWNPGTVSTR